MTAAALVDALGPGSTVGVVVQDPHGRTVLASPSTAVLDGLARRLSGPLQRAREAGRAEAGIEVAGGVASVHPLHGGYAAAVVALERMQDETAEERLAAALRLARIGIFTFDPRTDRRRWSTEVFRQVGLDPADPPDPEAWLATIAEADRRALDDLLERTLAKGEAWEIVVRRVTDDGPDRFILNKGFAQRGRDGSVIGLQGFTQDVTERLRAEARQRALADVVQVALARREVLELMQIAAQAVARALQVDVVGVLEVDPEDASWVVIHAGVGRLAPAIQTRLPLDSPRYHVSHVIRTGEPVLIPDWDSEARFVRPTRLMTGDVRSTAAVAIGRAPRPWGLLSAHGRRPRLVSGDDLTFLQAVASLLASAIDRMRDEQEIAALAAARGRLVAAALDAEDRARREISQLLRAGPLQELATLAADVAPLQPGDGDARLHHARAIDGIDRAMRELRTSMLDLDPVVLDVRGLEPAIAAIADQQAQLGGFAVRLEIDAAAAGARDELLLALARELLVNAARHARAAHVRVSVRCEGDAVVLEVADDGAGIAPGRLEAAPREGHIGLASSRERVEAIGGRLELRSAPGEGTTAVAVLPLP